MDFRFRQLLREYQATPEDSLATALFSEAQRAGMGFVDMREAGVPWSVVSGNLYRLNRAIMSPEAAQVYRRYVVEEHGSHRDFVKQKDYFVDTSGDWYPTWPGNKAAMFIGFTSDTRNWFAPGWHDAEAPGVRVSFYGRDDFGLERDHIPAEQLSAFGGVEVAYPDSVHLLEHVIRDMPNPVTQHYLHKQGFRRA